MFSFGSDLSWAFFVLFWFLLITLLYNCVLCVGDYCSFCFSADEAFSADCCLGICSMFFGIEENSVEIRMVWARNKAGTLEKNKKCAFFLIWKS